MNQPSCYTSFANCYLQINVSSCSMNKTSMDRKSDKFGWTENDSVLQQVGPVLKGLRDWDQNHQIVRKFQMNAPAWLYCMVKDKCFLRHSDVSCKVLRNRKYQAVIGYLVQIHYRIEEFSLFFIIFIMTIVLMQGSWCFEEQNNGRPAWGFYCLKLMLKQKSFVIKLLCSLLKKFWPNTSDFDSIVPWYYH